MARGQPRNLEAMGMHMYMCVCKSKVTHDTKFWGPEPSVVSPRNSAELPKISHKGTLDTEGREVGVYRDLV